MSIELSFDTEKNSKHSQNKLNHGLILYLFVVLKVLRWSCKCIALRTVFFHPCNIHDHSRVGKYYGYWGCQFIQNAWTWETKKNIEIGNALVEDKNYQIIQLLLISFYKFKIIQSKMNELITNIPISNKFELSERLLWLIPSLTVWCRCTNRV